MTRYDVLPLKGLDAFLLAQGMGGSPVKATYRAINDGLLIMTTPGEVRLISTLKGEGYCFSRSDYEDAEGEAFHFAQRIIGEPLNSDSMHFPLH